MIRIIPIGSGSSGNSMLVELDGRRILIDLGLSCRRISTRLAEFGITPAQVDAVLITHTHSDHVNGLKTFLKKYDGPLFMSHTTLRSLLLEDRAQGLDYNRPREILPGLSVVAVPTSHDCPGSACFRLETEETRFAFATDLGFVSEEILEQLGGCELMVLEANHDPSMLLNGPYPPLLKQRVRSDRGHLSNMQSAEAAAAFALRGTKQFLLAHLSEENNLPELARQTVQDALDELTSVKATARPLPAFGGEVLEWPESKQSKNLREE